MSIFRPNVLCDDLRPPTSSSSSFVVVVSPSQSERLEYLENSLTRITKFYTDIHADILYSHTGYDFTSYFQSEGIKKNLSKMLPAAASGGFFENGLDEDHVILHTYRNCRRHKCARYDVTSCFRSAAKCNKILHKSAQTVRPG